MSILFYAAAADQGIGGIDEYTKLMLHMDGDFGETGHDVASFGVPVFDNVTKKFNSSIYFDGSDSYLMLADSPDWDFGTGDYTIDFWINCASQPTSNRLLFDRTTLGEVFSNFTLQILTSNGHLRFLVDNGSDTGYAVIVEGSAVVTDSSWHHVAVVRSSGTTKVYVDGLEDISTSTVYNVSWAKPFFIGGSPSFAGIDYIGNIDEFRISDSARWTVPFSGSLPSSAYTSDANTKLLIHADGDISDSQHQVSMTGDPNFNNTTYKFAPSSLYFDGAGDYLVTPTSTDFQFGTGDFTVECWANTSTYAGDHVGLLEITKGAGASTDKVLLNLYPHSGVMKVHAVIGDVDQYLQHYEVGPQLDDGNWHHLALVRSGDTMITFVDGVVMTGGTTGGTNIVGADLNSTYFLRLAAPPEGSGSNYFTGYMDEVRVSKGIARWTTNFTPESGPYTE